MTGWTGVLSACQGPCDYTSAGPVPCYTTQRIGEPRGTGLTWLQPELSLHYKNQLTVTQWEDVEHQSLFIYCYWTIRFKMNKVLSDDSFSSENYDHFFPSSVLHVRIVFWRLVQLQGTQATYMLIHVCVSCVSWECLQYVCVRVPEWARARQKGRERQKEGGSEGISKGIKPKPQDISDLEGEWVKKGGGGGGKEKERKAEGKEQRDGEKEAESLEGSWKASRILCSNQP